MSLCDEHGEPLADGYDPRNIVGIMRARYGNDRADALLRTMTENALLTMPPASPMYH